MSRIYKNSLTLLTLFCSLLLTLPSSAERITGIDHIVAVIDDNVITSSELEKEVRAIKDQLLASNTAYPSDAVLRRQVLERAITKRLQLQLAERTGIRVDDETLNTAMRRIAKQNKLTLREFRETLESEGYSFATFREDIRNEITISRLQQSQINNRVSVTQQEINHFLANEESRGSDNQEYLLGHILIALPEGATPEQIQQQRSKAEGVLQQLRDGADFATTAVELSDGQNALEGGSLDWRRPSQIPTLFSEITSSLEVGAISDLIRSPSGFHIVKLNQVRGTDQRVVTQTRSRHILIRTDELTSADDARTRLEQLRERIIGGESFGDLARAHSQDKGTAVKGGELSWSSPGVLVPQFEAAMEPLQIGEISRPFVSPFGWHIVEVLERREYDSTDEFKSNRARETIRKRKIEEEREIWLRRLRDEAYVKIMLDE